MSQYCPVIIVGAGESGIAVGCLLRLKLGFTDFRIFDRQSGIGGAWHINRYPGVACDIPALFYSFSFAPNHKWTSLFPSGAEIQQYLVSVCQQFDIVRNIELSTEVREARWLPEASQWEVRITRCVPGAANVGWGKQKANIYADEEVFRCDVLVTCTGELAEPKPWPKNVPGIEDFEGEVMHSARWRDIDLSDKNVIVIGTGCTSAQLVPRLIESEKPPKRVLQLMRTAPWLMPYQKPPPSFNKVMMKALRIIPGLGLLLRALLFLYAESTWLNVGMGWFGRLRRRRFERGLLAHMQKTAPEKYHQMLKPEYGVGCKRIIIDGGWLDCLNDDRVQLTTWPLKSVGARSVILGPDGAGKTIDEAADVIILANGFDTSTYLHRINVINGDGVALADVWRDRGGPGAYLSTAVHGFPNFFMILGPCAVSGHSSAILASENVTGYALNFIRLVLAGDARTVEVKGQGLDDM